MDGFGQIGKYLKNTKRKADLSLKREVPLQRSRERIRDIFDPDNPVRATIKTPDTAFQVLVDFNFGKKLPSLECCGDCLCGITESYTSDSLIGSSLYVTTPYVPGSVVLYIDGIQATKGTDYVESDPTNSQITILVPATTFVVSYVYTVGNCTEAVCIDDRFECLGYTFMSGLATVFSDRFDRSASIAPSGGCGYYFTLPGFTRTDPFISGGTAIFGNNEGVWLGGVNRLVGKAVEVLAAIEINPTSGLTGSTLAALSLVGVTDSSVPIFDVTHNSSAIITKVNATTIRITVSGSGVYFTFDENPFGVIDTRNMNGTSFSASIDIPWTGETRYWFRYAQFATGEVSAKAWPQFTPEPTFAQVTTTLADSYATDPPDDHVNEISREEALGTINYLRLQGSFEALMVGAGLDNGWWGINATGDSATGYYCEIASNYSYPDLRFQYCDVVTNSITYGATSMGAHWTYSYAQSIGGNPPPTGDLGAIQDYRQNIPAFDVTDGYPGGLRLTGLLAANLWDTDYIVEIKKYPYGPLTMGGANGVQGGQTLASYTLPKDGTPVEMNVFVPVDPGESYVRVGIHVPNIATLATQQPYYFGPFLFPNNYGNNVVVYYLRAEGVQSVQCTTGPFCDDCSNTRCPDVVDSFDLNTTTGDFGTGDFVRQINQGVPLYVDKGTNTKVEFIGGTVKASFQGSTSGRTVNFDYSSPFDCYWEGSDFTVEATFDMRLSSTVSSTGEAGIGSVWWDVTGSTVAPGSFSISPTYASNGTNVTVNTWFSVKYRTEGKTLYLKTWVAGTPEPSAWSFTSAINSFPSGIGLFATGPASFTAEFRNLNVTKVV